MHERNLRQAQEAQSAETLKSLTGQSRNSKSETRGEGDYSTFMMRITRSSS